jgi:hypothetical protein
MPVSTFVNGLIAALKTPFAQKKINGNDIGNLSRVFDEFKLPGRTNAALYEQLMSELGKNALTIELDGEEEQDALGKKITDEMNIISESISSALFTPDLSDVKDEIKLAMGTENYTTLEQSIGKEVLMKTMLSAAVVCYSQVITSGCSRQCGISVDKETGHALDATESQENIMQRFGENIGMKINKYAQNIVIDQNKHCTEVEKSDLEKNINQCKKICDDYLKKLKKDFRVQFNDEKSKDQPFLQKLARDKYKIVKEAKRHLTDSNLNPKQQLAAFQRVLEDPKNKKTLSTYRDAWLMEAAKQVGSLFLINIYRLFMGEMVTRRSSAMIQMQTETKEKIKDMRSNSQSKTENPNAHDDSIKPNATEPTNPTQNRL